MAQMSVIVVPLCQNEHLEGLIEGNQLLLQH